MYGMVCPRPSSSRIEVRGARLCLDCRIRRSHARNPDGNFRPPNFNPAPPPHFAYPHTNHTDHPDHGMAQPTQPGPHALSLKVLRLSRPSLATQTPLPHTSFSNGLDIPPSASLAYPDANDSSSFPLTPLLTLPSAFGAAYVGETFTCALCVNDEVKDGEGRRVSGVRIVAELQTPGNEKGEGLELHAAEDEAAEDGGSVEAGSTMQRILKHTLKEEGTHVLVVTVTYTETLQSPDGSGGASGGRVRTFRKLYQFVAQQLIAVRSKVTARKRRAKEGRKEWVLEAQLENVGEGAVVLEKVWVGGRKGVGSVPFNGPEDSERTVLKPQDVEQVMFVLFEEVKEGVEGKEVAGRTPLAQLNVDWRGAMGERGSLTTGWLASRG